MNAILEIAASNVILSALLAVVTIAVTRVWRSPQLAHGLWLLVLLKLVTPPLVSVSAPSAWLTEQSVTAQTSLPASSGADNISRSTDDEGLQLPEPDLAMAPSAVAPNVKLSQRPAAIALDEAPMPIEGGETIDTLARVSPAAAPAKIPWPAAIAYVWLAGVMIYVTILVLRCIGFRRVLAASTDAGANITESVGRLAAKLRIRRCPPVRIVDAVVPPLVWSLGLRPVIVLPSKLLDKLSQAQRDALLAHELAHVRRRDDLVRWLEVIALVAFWWNPVAWFARRRLREAEEECCDAWVVWALPDERKSYGEAMLATIEFLADGLPLPALAGSTFGGSFYRRRIEMIMKRNVNCRISWAALGVIVLLAVGVLPLFAQTADSDASESSAQPDVATATDDAGATADARRAEDSGAATNAPSVEALPDAAIAGPSSDTVELAGEAQNAASPKTDATTVEIGEQARSRAIVEKLIGRIKRLLQEQSDQRGAAETSLRSRSSSLSELTPSSDKREQDLQGELLMLDILAAKAEIDPARIKWERSMRANKLQPGVVSDLEIEQQRAEVVTKEIQLKRAETLLALYKRQIERKREESARQQVPPGALATTRNSQLADARRRTTMQELVQLKKLNEQIGNEIARLEQLVREEPDSPDTWQAVNELWRTYRSVSERATKAANNDDGGNRNGTNRKK